MEQGSCRGCAGGILAFIVGGLVGAGASLLFAPQSGKETRKQIRNVADSVVDTTENYYEQIKKSVVSALEDGQEIFADKKERIMNAVKAGIEVYEKKQDADDTSDGGEAV
jgi:gas vesicle protein